MRCDIALALNLLMPRHNGAKNANWNHLGWSATFNSRKVSTRLDRTVHKLVGDYDKAWCKKHDVRTLDVVDNDVWFIQRTLRYSTMEYFAKRTNFAWQRWRPGRLPIFLKYRGKWIVWNGTHRTVLAMLTKKRLRVKVLDLDAFAKWRRAHPNKRMWGVRRVIVFGPRGEKRGNRK